MSKPKTVRMFSAVKHFFTKVKSATCAHQWGQLGNNCAKRVCEKCGEEQWLFENYPWSQRPRYEWKTMRRAVIDANEKPPR